MAKELSKAAKIAIGVVAGVTATTAIVVPTTIVMTRRGEEDSGYSITLDYNLDGMENEQITVAEGTKIADLTTKPVEGYSFAGWFKDEACTQKYEDYEVVTANSTIFAKYEILKFLVSFPTGDAFAFVDITGESEVVSGEVEYGSTISFKVDLEEMYDQSQITVTVNGETITPNGEDVYTVANIKDNIVVNISGVEVNSAVVTMNIDGVESSQEMEYGQFFSNDAITSDNSLGWYTDENFTNLFDPTTTPITENITLFTKMATLDCLSFAERDISIPSDISFNPTNVNAMTATLTNQTVEEIVVPLTYGGEAVEAIAGGSSEDNAILQSVYLSKNVKYIAPNTFENCVNLQSINLENVTHISNNAFESCSTLDVDFSKLTNLQRIGQYAFAGSGVTEFNPASTLQSVGNYAFSACENLTKVFQNYTVFGDVDGIFSGSPVNYIYINTSNYLNGSSIGFFSNFYSEDVEGVTVVIGKDVSVVNLLGLATSSGSINTNMFYHGFSGLIIKELIFEADKGNRTVEIRNFVLSTGSDTVVCDSQAVLNTFLKEGVDMYLYDGFNRYGKNEVDLILSDSDYYDPSSTQKTYNFYIKDTLKGADTLAEATSGINYDNVVITKAETSDREGYVKYTVQYVNEDGVEPDVKISEFMCEDEATLNSILTDGIKIPDYCALYVKEGTNGIDSVLTTLNTDSVSVFDNFEDFSASFSGVINDDNQTIFQQVFDAHEGYKAFLLCSVG